MFILRTHGWASLYVTWASLFIWNVFNNRLFLLKTKKKWAFICYNFFISKLYSGPGIKVSRVHYISVVYTLHKHCTTRYSFAHWQPYLIASSYEPFLHHPSISQHIIIFHSRSSFIWMSSIVANCPSQSTLGSVLWRGNRIRRKLKVFQ